MSYADQSEHVVWVDLGGAGGGYPSPLKLTISEVARLYRILGAALRGYSEHTTNVLAVLGDEADAVS